MKCCALLKEIDVFPNPSCDHHDFHATSGLTNTIHRKSLAAFFFQPQKPSPETSHDSPSHVHGHGHTDTYLYVIAGVLIGVYRNSLYAELPASK